MKSKSKSNLNTYFLDNLSLEERFNFVKLSHHYVRRGVGCINIQMHFHKFHSHSAVCSLGQKKKHKSCDRSKGVRQIRHRKREWNSCKLLGAVHKRRRQLGRGEGVKNYSKMLKIVLKICRYGVGGVINSEKLPTSFMDDHLGIFSSPNEEVKRHN